jgi:hypothetical protein
MAAPLSVHPESGKKAAHFSASEEKLFYLRRIQNGEK